MGSNLAVKFLWYTGIGFVMICFIASWVYNVLYGEETKLIKKLLKRVIKVFDK